MKETARFLSELGSLKNCRRTGWWLAGIRDPESLAEHSWRTAAIAFFLAKEEGLNAERVCTHAVFHDAAEARIGDFHRVASKYVKGKKEAEKKAFEDQWKNLPFGLPELTAEEKTVLKDADCLECALQAAEYEATGYPLAREWREGAGEELKLESSKKLFKEFKSVGRWWEGLKEKAGTGKVLRNP